MEKIWQIKSWYHHNRNQGSRISFALISHRSGKKEIQALRTSREIGCGQTVKVKKLSGEGPVKRRIMDMGITKGVEVTVRKVAPLGDPVEVTVRGYELSLRKADAEMIEVEK